MNSIRYILVVCHYLSILNSAEEELGAVGYRVTCVHKAEDAIRHLFTNRVDLIVLCSSLTEQQRRSILEQVHQRWHLPIVFLSSGKPDAVQQLLAELAAPHQPHKAA